MSIPLGGSGGRWSSSLGDLNAEVTHGGENHDVRRSVATHMAEQLDIHEGVIERISTTGKKG